MYENHYGFSRRPFSLAPDPDFLFLGKQHQKALDTIQASLRESTPFCVFTGETGSGKTTLLLQLIECANERYNISHMQHTHAEVSQFYLWLINHFNLQTTPDNVAAIHQAFIQFAHRQKATGKQCVLVIDEAQNLSLETLHALAELSFKVRGEGFNLIIILAGQKELKETLKEARLPVGSKQVYVSLHLTGLDEQDTTAYIRHRLSHAEGATGIFTDAACSEIYSQSNGIPRVINLLCDTALLYGYAENRQTIDKDIILSVKKDSEEKPGNEDNWIDNQDSLIAAFTAAGSDSDELQNEPEIDLTPDHQDILISAFAAAGGSNNETKDKVEIESSFNNATLFENEEIIDDSSVARMTQMFFEQSKSNQDNDPVDLTEIIEFEQDLKQDTDIGSELDPEINIEKEIISLDDTPTELSTIIDETVEVKEQVDHQLPSIVKQQEVKRRGRFLDSISLFLIFLIIVILWHHKDQLPFTMDAGNIAKYILEKLTQI